MAPRGTEQSVSGAQSEKFGNLGKQIFTVSSGIFSGATERCSVINAVRTLTAFNSPSRLMWMSSADRAIRL